MGVTPVRITRGRTTHPEGLLEGGSLILGISSDGRSSSAAVTAPQSVPVQITVFVRSLLSL